MIAAFLKNTDGDFDIPALAISLPMVFAGIYLLARTIPKAISTGEIWFGSVNMYYPGKGHTFERQKNPGWFWFAVIFYIFGALFFFTIAFVVSFGLMRNSKSN